MTKKGKIYCVFSLTVIANAVKQSRQTLLRHPEFISGSTNGFRNKFGMTNKESLLRLDSRIFAKSENDRKGVGNAKITTGLSAPLAMTYKTYPLTIIFKLLSLLMQGRVAFVGIKKPFDTNSSPDRGSVMNILNNSQPMLVRFS